MDKVYPLLPDGPVVCEVCAQTGRHAEMEQYAPKISDEDLAESDDTELQTYRCPDCESLTFFRVD
jgi:hypothetical protein